MSFVSLALAFLTFPAAASGETTLVVDGQTYSTSTGTGGGNCVVQDLGGSLGTDTTCADGDDMARANTEVGCVEREGSGTWSVGSAPQDEGDSDVQCDGRDTFTMNTDRTHPSFRG